MQALWERHVLPSLRGLPYWTELPPWAERLEVVAAFGVLVFVGVWWLGRLVFGPSQPRRPRVSIRRAERADRRAMRRAGNWLGLGAQHEDAGRWRKALAAYAKGGHDAERARLLWRRGESDQAIEIARSASLWALVGEIASASQQPAEAAVAYERAGEPFLAARAWDAAGDRFAAGRAYLVAGSESEALRRLIEGEGPEAASWVDRAIRAALDAGGLGVESRGAVRRGVQLWLSAGEPERALRLAVDADRPDLAVPVVRDHLDASRAGAEVCERAGAHRDAAELWRRLGDPRREAVARSQESRSRGEMDEAARWLERADRPLEAAEAWVDAGNLRRAADLYAAAGDTAQAEALRLAARGSQTT